MNKFWDIEIEIDVMLVYYWYFFLYTSTLCTVIAQSDQEFSRLTFFYKIQASSH